MQVATVMRVMLHQLSLCLINSSSDLKKLQAENIFNEGVEHYLVFSIYWPQELRKFQSRLVNYPYMTTNWMRRKL
jgi:hypothetical protein